MELRPEFMRSADYNALAQTLARLEPGVGAAELHGSLAGYLCAGGRAQADHWLEALALDALHEAVLQGGEREVFDRLYAECRRELDDPELSFDPLLPDDEDASLTERSAALVDWCRGFVGGIGLAGTDLRKTLSDEANEVLADLSRIAGTDVDEASDPDGEEDYTEVVEYVRVGAMLLRHELGVPPGATTH
jgi:yecA family protein